MDHTTLLRDRIRCVDGSCGRIGLVIPVEEVAKVSFRVGLTLISIKQKPTSRNSSLGALQWRLQCS